MSEVAAPPSADGTATARPATSLDARPELRAGTAPIKPEYLLNPRPIVEGTSSAALNDEASHLDADDAAEGRSSGDARDNKRRKKEKVKGQNKARSFPLIREAGVKICRAWEQTGKCDRTECRFAHDFNGYFGIKPDDIHYEPTAELASEEPYLRPIKAGQAGGEDAVGKTIDLSTTCPVYADLGFCPYGWRCRFLGGHVRKAEGEQPEEPEAGPSRRVGGWELLGKLSRDEMQGQWRRGETNWPSPELLQQLRSNQFEYPFSHAYLKKIEPEKEFSLMKSRSERNGKSKHAPKPRSAAVAEMDEEAMMNATVAAADAAEEEVANAETGRKGVVDGESEAIDVPLRPEEKRRLNWEGGLYLAPLTTVGNLPFRRLCVSYGASITISEMALAQPLVSGTNDEWALVRRHESEKMFGVQLAGGYPNRMVPAAELLRKSVGSGVDFVDINLGCPIDLVFNQGAGSALMDSPGRLGKILVGMNRALGEIPLTVKFRMGVANNKPNAHKLIPRFATEWGAGALTLHGRSRQQRYSKLADWGYIKNCASILRESLSDAGLPPVPIFGNGDCFSAQSYWEEVENSGVDGVMVARGALIKPWIFTEIKERREWDISATERLEGIGKFAEFGLSHWGSDTQGVNITRRFLCEALSFQHRYIPIGILERLPPKLNERPPAYRGRNELETLLSSPFVGDWIKISEMFLGKVDEGPAGFKFVPKHKSNAYGGEEAQG